MELDYSFGNIPPLYFRGELPHPEIGIDDIKVNLKECESNAFFPATLNVGMLLYYRNSGTGDSAVTLVLRHQVGTHPASSEPIADGVWREVPNSPVYSHIRVALTKEAVDLIQKGSSDGYAYELTLRGVRFSNKTPNVLKRSEVNAGI